MKTKCMICKEIIETKNKRGFCNHLRRHGLTIKEYELKFPTKYPTPEGEYGKDYVTCPICNNNKTYQSLTQHLINKHKMTTEQFLLDYPDSKLFTESYSNMRRDNCRKGLKKMWNDPGYRELRKEYCSKFFSELNSGSSRPEQSQRMHETLKRLWSDPEYRDKQSKKMKKQHEDGLYKDISKGLRNGWIKYDHKGKSITLKSKWELQVALALDAYDIDYDYEVEYEYYDSTRKCNRKYYADFYLPKYNLVIEVKAMWAISKQVNLDKMKAVINSGVRFIFFTEQEMGSLDSKTKLLKIISR